MLDIPARMVRQSADEQSDRVKPEDRLSLRSILAVFWRRAGIIAACVATALTLAILYLALTPARFTATAVLATDTKRTPSVVSEMRPDTLIDTAVVDSQVEIIRSEKIAITVVEKLNLANDPLFVGPGPGRLTRTLAAIGLISLNLPSEEVRLRVAVDGVKQGLKVVRLGRSYVTEISFTSTDPRKAASIANEVAEAYIEDQLGARLLSAQRAGTWMQQRTGELRQQAENAALAFALFRTAQPNLADADGKLTSERELADAMAERARIATTPRGAPDQAIAPSGDGAAAPMSGNELGQPSAVEAYDRRIAGLRARVAAEKPLLVTMRDLETTAETSRMLHESFVGRLNQTRYNQTVQQQSFPSTEARILTQATPPPTKTSPRVSVTLVLAMLAGVTLGSAAAFARDLSDRMIREARDLDVKLGVTPFGIVPKLRLQRSSLSAAEQGGLLRLSEHRSAAAIDKTLRRVKIAIDQAAGGCRVVGITAPRTGAGSTTIAYNLALLSGESGGRTLLIDADLRDRRLSTALAPDLRLGLSDILRRRASLATAALSLERGLHLLGETSGPLIGHPADTLSLPSMQGLIDEARLTYDYVIVDLPAVLDQLDVRAAASAFDLFVLIVEGGRTTIDEVEGALASVPVVGDRLVGGIINKATIVREFRNRFALTRRRTFGHVSRRLIALRSTAS